MISTLVAQDFLFLRRSTSTWILLAALVAAFAVAALNASSVVADHEAALQRLANPPPTDADKAATVLPPQVRRPVLLPTDPLALLALGRTRLDAAQASASYFSRDDLLFANYQIASPLVLQGGGFDIAFVVVVFAPLIVIALGYGMIASDRDAGRLRQVLANPVSAQQVLFARVLTRAPLVLLPLIGAVLAVALALDRPFDDFRLALWLATAIVYLAFWWALVAFANTLQMSSERTAVTLLAVWAVLVLVLPALLSTLASAASPPPSRHALVAEVRQAEVAARDSVDADLKRFAHDHPDLVYKNDPEIAQWMKNYAMQRLRVEERVAAPLAAFDQALDRQIAFVSLGGYLTPTLATHRILTDAAGTGQARHRAFRVQAREFNRSLRGVLTPAAVAGRPFTRAEADGVMRFAFKEEAGSATLQRAAGPLLFWFALSLLLAAAAAWRSRSITPA